jgi:hypothetical protein
MDLDLHLVDSSVVSFRDGLETIRVGGFKAHEYRWYAFRVSHDGVLSVRERRIVLDVYYGHGVISETVSTIRRCARGEWTSADAPPSSETSTSSPSTPEQVREAGLRQAAKFRRPGPPHPNPSHNP